MIRGALSADCSRAYARAMRIRPLVTTALVAGFVVAVVQASFANQCPASALGACARLHLELMRPRSVAPPLLVALPMRADAERG